MDTLGPLVLAGLVVTMLLARSALRGREHAAPARTQARWAGATLAGLLTVGAAGIALMRAVA